MGKENKYEGPRAVFEIGMAIKTLIEHCALGLEPEAELMSWCSWKYETFRPKLRGQLWIYEVNLAVEFFGFGRIFL